MQSKNKLTLDLLGLYLEKTVIQKKKIHAPSMFIAALLTIARAWKQPKCPTTGEWIKKTYIYTTEYYSVIKRGWNCAICRDLNGP